ncbi:DUF4349 domain-containing protein [Chryseobacterium koreense]|uniref:DUF4349 domain-containing protein n=1 Tax=Chryseobacterium koreense CCUG 49689 TaxID=1304281 RepID=A0A0J7J3L6_9FLAO|nr:DUF4349 domain-containing protein [Chryseobacterium koreense]KMQ72556.1 hypothetical protein ACM44_00160 [Chryseobacterium koreense CCUG 49689]MBB5332936.1 prefoldin subunit 5 [Chryseobacterium koreense]
MKKLFFSILIGIALISCDKSSIQQTTDQIKKADSLFNKANAGIKTLDSISKKINSKDGIARKVIIPEIEKQKKAIDSTIKAGSWQIDSINKQIQDITKNVKSGTDLAKTLDSANSALKKGAHPLDVLSKTADKILKQTKTQKENVQTPSKSEVQSENSPSTVPLIVEKNPLVKTAQLQIQVENLTEAKALLKQKFRDHHADLVAENFSQTEGISKESFSAKVPLSYFDQLVESASTLGEIRMKSTVSQGMDYDSKQLCDVEISLFQNENSANISANKDTDSLKTGTFGDKSSNALLQGSKILGEILLFLLPFWPILLIGILVWYIVARNKKRKARQEFERQQSLNQQKIRYPEENQTSTEPVSEPENQEEKDSGGHPDYSKYMPKK